MAKKKKETQQDGYQPEDSLDTNNPPGNEMYISDERREKLRTATINNEQVKRISAKEFRDEGYLQEANRMFFHPLGLALEVITNEEGNTVDIGGIWDYREEAEGMRYNIANRSEEEQEEMKDKALHVQNQMIDKAKTRINMFGGVIIEPIPGINIG